VADLANVFLPSDCRICGGPLLALGPVGVCEECVAQVGASTDQDLLCTRCGDALGMESARFSAAMGVTECTLCRLAPPEFSRAVAAGNYDNEMREMLHLLKFAGRRSVAEHVLGGRLAAAILKLRGQAGNDLLVVPVPLFAARERARGYNQARLLAQAALQRLRRTAPAWQLTLCDGLLLRVRDTRALYRLGPSERRRSLQGAFQLAAAPAAARTGRQLLLGREALPGREVLLIDDILTTGATARACARVLLRAGAAKVWVATAARSQPDAAPAAQPQQDEVALWTASARTRVLEPDIGTRIAF
jgi:ComF family protein